MTQRPRKIVYVAGQITGIDDYAARFEEAERALTEKGYMVINPVKIPGAEDITYDEIIEGCKKRVETADFLYMLKNWANSKGARIELRHFLATHGHDENLVWYEAWEEIPTLSDARCGKCLYHLPDIDEFVCVHEESPRAGDHTRDDEMCSRYHEYKRSGGGV